MGSENGVLLLRTAVRPQMRRYAFFRSCIIGGLAMLFLMVADFLLPLAGIESLGIWRWLASGSALGATYIPFKKLRWQNEHPEMLQINDKELILIQNNGPLFQIPWDNIASFHFVDKRSSYGLAFNLKEPARSANIPSAMLQKSRREQGVDIFLPFFSKHSYQLLQQWHQQNVLDL